MRLLELEIERVRGIQHLLVKPEGRNFVIWGPNGSGKSAVVDAINFLLSGRIQRLTGRGTGDISLSRHGPHIDHDPKETMVRGKFKLRSSGKIVDLERSIGQPKILKCSIGENKELRHILALSEQGVHILSRREILKYITADANTRAQEIQELLDISEIEETRKTLVKVKNDLLRNLQSAQNGLAGAESQVNATIGEQKYEQKRVLSVVNQNRSILGASPISDIRSVNLKRDVSTPTVVSRGDGLNVTIFNRDINNLRNVTSRESVAFIEDNDKGLRDLIEKIRSNPELIRTLKRIELIKMGIRLMDEAGNCPLCDKPWPEGKLLEYLRKRLETAKVAAEYQNKMGKLVSTISGRVNNTIASLQKIIAGVQIVGLKDERSILESWLKNLQEFSVSLGSAIERYLETGHSSSEVKRMLAPKNIVELLINIEKFVSKKYPVSTPEQTGWDTLTRLEENLRVVESAQAEVSKAIVFAKRGALIEDRFLTARDRILGQLYESIKDGFVGLYRQLHGEDEEKFGARIEPDEAGINLEVDFYGRGSHPPHALHSEGHQDSMGLCLFLALTEYLTKGLIDLIVLDDVVMSVDIGHRRRMCEMLAKNFPERQFLITTHDKTWANQLRAEGVVGSKDTIEFYNWCLDLGPQVNYEADMWQQVNKDLDGGDISSAAHKLRRGSEEFFATVCDSLQARVKYKLSGRWELGDFLPAAMSQYRSLLKTAKSAAQSWGNKENFDKLQEFDTTVGQIYQRCGAEQWALNANVHYNNWVNFSKSDFQPVTEAFQDLFALFLCTKCAGMLHVVQKDAELVGVRCNCGFVNWNLKKS